MPLVEKTEETIEPIKKKRVMSEAQLENLRKAREAKAKKKLETVQEPPKEQPKEVPKQAEKILENK